METANRRTTAILIFGIFGILLIIPVVFIEIFLYGIRWILTKKSFPDPISFVILKRLW